MADRRGGGVIDRRAFAKGAAMIGLAPLSAAWAAEPEWRQHTIGFAPPLSRPLTTMTETRVRTGRSGEGRAARHPPPVI